MLIIVVKCYEQSRILNIKLTNFLSASQCQIPSRTPRFTLLNVHFGQLHVL